MGFNLIGERVFVHQTRLQPQRININGPPKARERECARRAEYARLNIQITAATPGGGRKQIHKHSQPHVRHIRA